jgi:hypothetical protein
MLAAERGSAMRIRTDGEDAEQAMDALLALVAAGFNEMYLTGSGVDDEDPETETERTSA